VDAKIYYSRYTGAKSCPKFFISDAPVPTTLQEITTLFVVEEVEDEVTDAFSTQFVPLRLSTAAIPCSVSSKKMRFQVRVLDTECQMWEEDLKADIASDFRREIVNTIIRVCDDCVITTQDIEVAAPTCSEQVNGAAIFKGTVSTESLFRTQDIFCALMQWQLSGLLVQISMVWYRVDQNCSTEVSHLECGVEFALPQQSSAPVNTVVTISVVVTIGVLVIGAFISICGKLIAC
jgi:hypothetical protein